jgi:NAD(P)-dependent dehydrogenase (short-subunit alcohol dehydrogenase family)
VVTGAGRGIGAAVATTLAEAGAAVVVAARTTGEIEQVASTLRSRGAQAWAVPCDVADEGSVRALGEAARRHLGTVDILVNDAGVSGSAPLGKITLTEWNRMLAVNATGTFLCTRELTPDMVERRWGRIVNIASLAGLEGGRYVAHYSASKHAVIGFTRSVALELAGTGVTINALCPGYADTPMTERTLESVQSHTGLPRDRALAAVLASTGQDRLVRPQEVAEVVLRLCREERNGEVIVLGRDRAQDQEPQPGGARTR